MTEECESHNPPVGRLVADLPLIERLRAIASCMPCDEPTVSQIGANSPIAKMLNEVADLLERSLTDTAKAIELVRLFDIYDSVPGDHGYVGSGLYNDTKAFLAGVDGTGIYAEWINKSPGQGT